MSFVDAVKRPASVLSGANLIPVGQSPRVPLPLTTPAHLKGRKYVFDRLKIPKVSAFDRLEWLEAAATPNTEVGPSQLMANHDILDDQEIGLDL
jgi:hypothetical protein